MPVETRAEKAAKAAKAAEKAAKIANSTNSAGLANNRLDRTIRKKNRQKPTVLNQKPVRVFRDTSASLLKEQILIYEGYMEDPEADEYARDEARRTWMSTINAKIELENGWKKKKKKNVELVD